MEECYMTLTMEYDNEDTKVTIREAIASTEKEMKMYPKVYRKAISDDAGNFCLEFDTDSDCSRKAGEFFEKVMKIVGIDRCD
jgi:hypothetical protein